MSFETIDILSLHNEVRRDRQLQALCPPIVTVKFAVEVVNDLAIVVDIIAGQPTVRERHHEDTTLFTLSATSEIWSRFYQARPELGYQSFLAMSRPKNDTIASVATVLGDELGFARYIAVWRRFLEICYRILVGCVALPSEPTPDEDHIVGRYLILDLPKWGGRCKVYYEQSGHGNQDIVFLHTAGSDGRQYHGVMNDPRMLDMDVRMTVFDLPSHGRSFPPDDSVPGEHYNSEDRYIEVIAAVIKKLQLKRVVVSGASMAGLICLGVALRNDEVGAFGVIPVQGCEYVNMKRAGFDKHPEVNQSLFAPEFSYGMMSPFSPERNKHLVWHTYSGQAFGVYKGDLDFHFGGFDYRGWLGNIDTTKCRIAMLTGEYDWSLRPEMSMHAAKQIKGCYIKIMEGLGHFPASENPPVFVGHFIEALKHVNK